MELDLLLRELVKVMVLQELVELGVVQELVELMGLELVYL